MYWFAETNCVANQYSKTTGRAKDFKEENGYKGFGINFLPQHQTIY